MRIAFFDRDGTINVNYGHVYRTDDLDFVEGIPEKIKEYNELNIPVIVVTNQAGIAKGYYTIEQAQKFNDYLNCCLREKFGAYIDAFYMCPHHPDYTGECNCRKPKAGLFFQAAKDFSVNFSKSIMYGDKETDRQAAIAAGILDFCLVECEKNLK